MCQCPAGYKFIDRGGFASSCQSTVCGVSCIIVHSTFSFYSLDINECEDGNACPNNLICKDVPGSYECTCNNGTIREADHCIRTCTCCIVHNTFLLFC